MAEPVVEQIAQWIETELDGVEDPGLSLTLNTVRPAISDWSVSDYAHGNVVIEEVSVETDLVMLGSKRIEKATFSLYGVIREIPSGVKLGAMLARISETIRRTLLASNSKGRACGNLALRLECPETQYAVAVGCDVAAIKTEVTYATAATDGYEQVLT